MVGFEGGDCRERVIGLAESCDVLLHFGSDALPGSRVSQALADRRGAIGEGPTGYEHAKFRARPVVWILIYDDVDALKPESLHESERLGARSPKALVIDLEVGEFHGTRAALPTVTASSIASNTCAPSFRMWLA